MPELLHTALTGLPPAKVGKVREVYDLGSELLLIATDRISAFDVVMANGIPDKGVVLNRMSAFWFDFFGSSIPNHFISIDSSEIDKRLSEPHPELYGRTMISKKAKPLPIECVARGYITGSLFKEYQQLGSEVHDLHLPSGLQDGSRLQETIFTPASKAESGHDENLSESQAIDTVGRETFEQVKAWTLELYNRAAAYAETKGIIIADTKFEFGETEDGIILIDEVLSPDSSRFWQKDLWTPGQVQPSYDKQFVRNYLETLDWNKQPPGPTLPADVVEGTRARYLQAFEHLTGKPLEQAT